MRQSNAASKLVEQPFASSMTNMSDHDRTDREATSPPKQDSKKENRVLVILPAPAECKGRGQCRGCPKCNPRPRPYASDVD